MNRDENKEDVSLKLMNVYHRMKQVVGLNSEGCSHLFELSIGFFSDVARVFPSRLPPPPEQSLFL